MKLSKLYCNDLRFTNITFNLSGLNVVYADVKAKAKEKKNSHDLGKTKLSELIDFLLLKEIDHKHFLIKIKNNDNKSIFNNHIFYLELLLNDGRFLTIRRGVDKNTKISFAISQVRSENYKPPPKWEQEDLPIKKAKKELGEYLKLDFFQHKESYDYRKAISYCLRTPPADYNDVYQLSKFSKGKDKEWKPFVFDLLGFKGDLLLLKYENDIKRDEIKGRIDYLKGRHTIKVEDRDDYVAQLKLEEEKATDIEKKIDSFNFYERDRELVTKGVEELESQIGELNSLSYSINYDIDRLRKSIKNNFSFDIEKVQKVFEESKLYFPEQLKEDYTALLNFNSKLTLERNKLLKQTLYEKEEELKRINSQLEDLNKKKENLISFIQDTDSFRKFKHYQKELVKIEGSLLEIREKIISVDEILKEEEEINKLVKEIEGTVKELKEIYQHTEDNSRYSIIRNNFSNYYKKIMNEEARLSWKINNEGNVEFVPPKVHSRVEKKKITAKDEGTTYKKLLCVAFDLAILCTYNRESYFRFVYHDDVLSQQDHGIKTRLLDLIKEINDSSDLQYILSVIKSDLPQDQEDKVVYFNDSEIILKLHDKDKSGTLFGFEF